MYTLNNHKKDQDPPPPWKRLHPLTTPQNYLTPEEIPYRRAVNTFVLIIIYLESVDDFRQFTRKLETDQTPYSTHQLSQDKDLINVLRGVIESLSDADIRTELENKKLPIR